MRKFAFVILDERDQVVDRFNLDYVDGLSGLGFSLDLSKIETDVEDYVTKIRQKKQAVGLTLHHLSGYKSGDYLKLWLAKHIDSCLCIEYNNTQKVKYVEGKVVDCGETELNEFKVLEQKISFQPTTPFFEKKDNDIKIQVSDYGKTYPLSYPYCYGKNRIENNVIENNYIKDIPLIVTIYGAISNPVIILKDSNDQTYNEVRFIDVDLQEGEQLIINSAQKKIIFKDANGNQQDYYFKLDGGYDSFLRAQPLEVSTLNINLTATDTGYLIGSRRQYTL
ncbi:MAG: hypothetical protein ACI4R8_01125 [Candidatus Caccovivens sp.]